MESKPIPLNREKALPTSIPEKPGIYHFLDRYGKPLYIGKAANIRKRILTHDYTGEGILTRHSHWIHFVKWELTGNTVVASLLEDHRIRSYWPVLNRAQKSKPLKFSVEYYLDQQERWRMSVVTRKSYHHKGIHFHSYPDAIDHVAARVRKWDLNGGLCNVPFNRDVDTGSHQEGFLKMLDEEQGQTRYDLFFGKGREQGELSFILINNQVYQGFGFIDEHESRNPHSIRKALVDCLSSPTTEKIIQKLMEKSGVDFSFTGMELSNVTMTMKPLPVHRKGSYCIQFDK